MTLFQLQLILSFLTGGILVTALTLIAERASERTAGLIITLPSTVAMSFLFIGWTIGPDQIPNIFPPIPIGIGAVLIFAASWLYLSKIKIPKIPSMILCFCGSLGIWFALMLPIAFYGITLTNSLIGFAILTPLAYLLITRQPQKESTLKKILYSPLQLFFRAIFIGGIITLAVYLAKILGPTWGGVFSAFPAVFTSTLLILHWHYDSAFLFKTFRNAPLGNIGFLAFGLLSMWSFPTFGVLGGTLVAYSGSALIFLVTLKFLPKKN